MMTLCDTSAQNSNIISELNIKNAQLIYFSHKITNPDLSGKEFFRPYLTYVDKKGISKDHLMDAFVLVDQFYHYYPYADKSIYDGIYDEVFLQSYLMDVFVRTRLPIIKKDLNSNHFAELSNIASATLTSTVNLPKSDSINLSFDLTFNEEFLYNRDYEFIVGWEYLDESGNKLDAISQTNGTKSEWYDFYFKTLKINLSQTIKQTILIPTDIQNKVSRVKIHLMNYDKNPVVLQIDNIQILSDGNNLLNHGDSGFDLGYNKLTTNWEYRKQFDIQENRYLFKGRIPLIDEVKLAKEDVTNIQLPQTKLILTLPDINIDYYLESNKKEELFNLLKNFVRSIFSNFQNWRKNNQNSNIQIAGIYIYDESINGQKAEKMRDVLSFLKSELSSLGWALYGSPYMVFNEDLSIESTYSYSIFQYFDILWQQPNVFFNHFSRGNIDRSLLRKANKLIQQKNLNINIESFLPNPYENYSRVIDYFTYGEKYGYINSSKMYYDEAGGYFLYANSKSTSDRKVYDLLYDFINNARKGVLINGNFETLNDNGSLNGWTGQYTCLQNGLFNLSNNSYKTTIPAFKSATTEFIYLKQEKEYILNFTMMNNDSLSFVINQYNKQGKLLKEDYLNSTESRFHKFKTNNDSSGIIIKINNHSSNELIIQNLNIFPTKHNERKWFFSDPNFLSIIRSTPDVEYGNNSLELGYAQYTESTYKIPIQNDIGYNLSVSYKESLPIKEGILHPKAFIGIETFNEEGKKINVKISNTFYYENLLDMQVAELKNFNTNWRTFNEYLQFATDVKSLKIYLYNNQYNNLLTFDNVLFQNTTHSMSVDLYSDNLLNEDKWTDRQPFQVTKYSPVTYLENIEIKEKRILEFSALIRDENSTLQPDLCVSIEYFDRENLPINNPAPSFNNDLQYLLESENPHINSSQKWYNNKWVLFKRKIRIPNKVAYIRVTFFTSSKNHKIEVLNPYLKVVED